ncbi:50S ribosomal protein L35 ['Elaeagnus angustifolia' witches'-broom phytoplasma]|uniref:Large ribosomal subunit protein bL35 n=4 Tax=16SrI (Aster yellows group) TaxID=3042590 RepID=RL35_AYWBP|nr:MULTISPECIES: 50S ribosomal protein L35 [Phytoplasma]Q2NIG5.1 RecName: Full=Large ribosomal subunit protein bL35; AltName: Full=50S ribosomal protein L35 [Aster yellows witches'-broom phytoplasma AYWB]MBT1576753.1 50S ribosomal protein L35 ['Elaeagnus angustifolia' witches'-broom phytoplasma]MBY7576838.1 50S ribosomal protein L35 [Candidatus Phytoplasma australiense]ABC65778.1 LSU ribosomal protein L35P [Aster yellows witches'-broom phytoplasma AYWB]MBS2993899.1 50S ribosomal protein L35 ['
MIKVIKKKSHSGLKKRIKITKKKKLLRGHAYKNHLAASKTTKQNRQLRGVTCVKLCDYNRIKTLIRGL